MTLPPSLSDLEAESEAEPELSRMTLVVGTLRIDVGLPPNVSIANFIDDVIDIANDQISAHPELAGSQFDTAEDKWTLGRLGADPIDPSRSLAEANVSDGELLSIREIGEPFSPLLFDDVEDVEVAPDRANVAWMTWFVDNQRMIGYLVTGLAVATAAALLLPSHAGDLVLAGTTLGLGVFGVIVACVLALRSGGTTRPQWVSVVATPLLFGGPLYVIPEGFGAKALPMAFGLTALSSLVMLLITGNGRALHTTVITLSALGGASTSAQLLWHLPQRTIGAAVATLAVVVIYVSPRVTIALSKLPIPRVPTAGEPLDDIETQGGTTVEGVNAIGKQIIPTEEGMIGRLRRANAYLTGMLVAAAITAAVGCYLCVGGAGGFYWQGTAFSVAVATVLCLRGRSHHDLIQSATLIGAGLVIALTMIVSNGLRVRDGQVDAALALVGLIALIIACGIVAPRLEFSPVMRRQVELLEYLAIAMVFPLCFWIVRLYAFFRELRI
ncbi:type VII secretion integral membrane protein EccD [Mycolicibacterium insubricum]|uniref:Type VII secretion integral membrane protein EccD n=2 Tax=Mycolicibacterium insubricum TaxID=444597 RepID=A0A1X0DCD1_9MYCO|nr:type VII secretion integral membrane protein EccD [Mycolicibacterium insubricum]BBZ67165.1 type VII secretion integral membrane protein EccD [Mycolicibacterium insubricum]